MQAATCAAEQLTYGGRKVMLSQFYLNSFTPLHIRDGCITMALITITETRFQPIHTVPARGRVAFYGYAVFYRV
jgi:hypothetical protein